MSSYRDLCISFLDYIISMKGFSKAQEVTRSRLSLPVCSCCRCSALHAQSLAIATSQTGCPSSLRSPATAAGICLPYLHQASEQIRSAKPLLYSAFLSAPGSAMRRFRCICISVDLAFLSPISRQSCQCFSGLSA